MGLTANQKVKNFILKHKNNYSPTFHYAYKVWLELFWLSLTLTELK